MKARPCCCCCCCCSTLVALQPRSPPCSMAYSECTHTHSLITFLSVDYVPLMEKKGGKQGRRRRNTNSQYGTASADTLCVNWTRFLIGKSSFQNLNVQFEQSSIINIIRFIKYLINYTLLSVLEIGDSISFKGVFTGRKFSFELPNDPKKKNSINQHHFLRIFSFLIK